MRIIESAATFPLKVIARARYTRKFQWTAPPEDQPDADPEVIPLADLRATAQIRDKANTLLLDLDEYLDIDLPTNKIVLDIPADVTATMQKGSWDLFLVDVNDATNAQKLLKGAVTVEPAITIDD